MCAYECTYHTQNNAIFHRGLDALEDVRMNIAKTVIEESSYIPLKKCYPMLWSFSMFTYQWSGIFLEQEVFITWLTGQRMPRGFVIQLPHLRRSVPNIALIGLHVPAL